MDKTELIKKLNLSQKEVMAYLKMASLSEKEISLPGTLFLAGQEWRPFAVAF